MITNIYRINYSNCGDLSSSPFNYFSAPFPVNRVCISSLDKVRQNYFSVFGGGGLIYDEWLKGLSSYFNDCKGIAIGWGVGLNIHELGNKALYPSFVNRFQLLGVRDFGFGLRWVPCASCMHHAFDHKYHITKEIGVFEHVEVPLNVEHPKFKNNKTVEEALEFIGGCEKIITNSYHGAYWSLLLGKKVIVLPVENSSRFYFFKHKPKIVDYGSLNFEGCQIYENALQECRDANKTFYKDFLCLINSQKMI